jgi:hypothetical protein
VAREAAAEFELAPSLAVKDFVVLPTAELVETVPTVVEIALAAPVEFVVEAAPTAAGVALAAPVEFVVEIDPTVVVPTVAASFGSVEVSVVAEQQLARLELCDRCEGVARCTRQPVSPIQ